MSRRLSLFHFISMVKKKEREIKEWPQKGKGNKKKKDKTRLES